MNHQRVATAQTESDRPAYLYDLQLEHAPGVFIPAEQMRASPLIHELPGRVVADVMVQSAMVGLYGDERVRWVCQAGSACAILGAWSDGSFKVRLRIALADNSHGASSRVFVGRFPGSLIELLEAPLTGNVLAANVDEPVSAAPPATAHELRPRPIMVAAILLIAAVLAGTVWLGSQASGGRAITSATPAAVQQVPQVQRVASPVPAAADQPQGNASADSSCLDVGGRTCLKVDPKLKQAVALLQTTAKGPALLRTAVDSSVRVRFGAAPAGALADFLPGTRTITLGPEIEHATGRAQASVLAHELQHVSDWSKVGPLFNNSFNCYQTEASAFQTQAAVWSELRGDNPPAGAVEQQLDEVAQGVQHGGSDFWMHVAGAYADECTG